MKIAAHFGILSATLCALLLAPQAFAAADTEDEYRAVLKANIDTSHGGILFETCARCHGANGAGQTDGSVPAIAGQHFRVIARQLVDYRHDERWDVYMEHFADFPTLIFTQDVADVAGYISSLERAGPRAQGNGEYLDHRAELYARRCASCHGAHGEGSDTKGYPRLAAQHYPYLVRQMHDALEGRRPNFSRPHVRLLSRFDRDDIDGVADYLSRLPP
jgi:cytochrome c553